MVRRRRPVSVPATGQHEGHRLTLPAPNAHALSSTGAIRGKSTPRTSSCPGSCPALRTARPFPSRRRTGRGAHPGEVRRSSSPRSTHGSSLRKLGAAASDLAERIELLADGRIPATPTAGERPWRGAATGGGAHRERNPDRRPEGVGPIDFPHRACPGTRPRYRRPLRPNSPPSSRFTCRRGTGHAQVSKYAGRGACPSMAMGASAHLRGRPCAQSPSSGLSVDGC